MKWPSVIQPRLTWPELDGLKFIKLSDVESKVKPKIELVYIVTIENLLFGIKNTIFMEADIEHDCVSVTDGDELAC